MVFHSVVLSVALGVGLAPAADPAAGKSAKKSETAKEQPKAAKEKPKADKEEPKAAKEKPKAEIKSVPRRKKKDAEPFDPTKLVPRSALVSTDPALVEQCNGTRGPAKAGLNESACSRWRLEWIHNGQMWGSTTAASKEALLAERELLLTFDRRYAKLFGGAADERMAGPSAPICLNCRGDSAAGRWGDGQRFSGQPIERAQKDSQTSLDTLEVALLSSHAPAIDAVARLSREKKTSSTAKRYAKQMRAAMTEMVELQLTLDNAGVLHDTAAMQGVVKTASAHHEALDRSRAALALEVAAEVARAHAGTYEEEGATSAPAQILVEFDGPRLTATYIQGAAKSVWFEGQVELDGSLSGQSLMAPEGSKLSCASHSTECGYAYIPSILRFSTRPSGSKTEVLELWFKQSKWVQAKPFSR